MLTDRFRMATPLIIGLGSIAAALGARHYLRQRALQGAEQWLRGGFQAKMDRNEAIQILGLRHVPRCAFFDA